MSTYQSQSCQDRVPITTPQSHKNNGRVTQRVIWVVSHEAQDGGERQPI
uniref:Uncharacterized protein n=1 Tax=Anguilla anguilla TaxID=7936 RepID=A0A0E9V3U8_ANGAN